MLLTKWVGGLHWKLQTKIFPFWFMIQGEKARIHNMQYGPRRQDSDIYYSITTVCLTGSGMIITDLCWKQMLVAWFNTQFKERESFKLFLAINFTICGDKSWNIIGTKTALNFTSMTCSGIHPAKLTNHSLYSNWDIIKIRIWSLYPTCFVKLE